MIDAPSSTWFSASPGWHWLIVLYFFIGGLAGGCYFLAALVDLVGRPEDRPLARLGYLVALPAIVVSGLLLLFDLARPPRFWHLFVGSNSGQLMFKSWSPMSTGSWALLVFGVFSLLSALAAAAEAGWLPWRRAARLRPPGALGIVVTVLGAFFGLYITGYTGVLLAVTSQPVWADSSLIGMLLVVSATSISAALLILLSQSSSPALRRLEVQLIALELLVLIALVFSLGGAARALLLPHNLLLLLGVLLLGIALPLLLHWRDSLGRRSFAAAPVLVLVGGFLLRTLVVFAPYGIGR